MNQPRALISIGTNSTRLLIVDEHDAVIALDSRGTRLGAGLQHDGRLDAAARERTLGAVGEYVAIVRAHDARVACIATSAMRRATDGASFADDVTRSVGAAPRILSGEEEATFSFLGATRGVRGDERVGVLDVGGGSSELAVDVPARAWERKRVDFAVSVEIGAVRLAERHPEVLGAAALTAAERHASLASARDDVRTVLQPYAAAPAPARLLVVGGTAFTAASMVAGAQERDAVTMTRERIGALIDALLARSLDERKAMPFIRPQRADILPAGLLIVDEACAILGIDAVTVSVDDLLAGYLASADYDATAVTLPPRSTAG